MDGFNIGKILLGLRNPELFLKKLQPGEQPRTNSFVPDMSTFLNNSNPKPAQTNAAQTLQNLADITQALQMNTFANTDRSVFVRNIMGLPQDSTAPRTHIIQFS